MIKRFLFILFTIFLQLNTIGQIGYLGKKFSLDISANVPINVIHNDLKLNYIIGEKIEIFGVFGKSFNSKYYIQKQKNYAYSNLNVVSQIDFPYNIIGEVGPLGKTDLKLNVSYFGVGIRYYIKTLLAPIGHYIELQYSGLQAEPEDVSRLYYTDYNYYGLLNYNESFKKITLKELMIGLHRKRIFKDGWYISTGLKIPLRWYSGSRLNYANECTELTLKSNKWFFQISFGKMLF